MNSKKSLVVVTIICLLLNSFSAMIAFADESQQQELEIAPRSAARYPRLIDTGITLPQDALDLEDIKIKVDWGDAHSSGLSGIEFYYESSQNTSVNPKIEYNIPVDYKYYTHHGAVPTDEFVTIKKEFFTAIVNPITPKVGHKIYFKIKFYTPYYYEPQTFTLTVGEKSIEPSISPSSVNYYLGKDGDANVTPNWGTGKYKPIGDGIAQIAVTYNSDDAARIYVTQVLRKGIDYTVNNSTISIKKKFLDDFLGSFKPRESHKLYFDVTFDAKESKTKRFDLKLKSVAPDISVDKINYTSGDLKVPVKWGTVDYAPNGDKVNRVVITLNMPWGPMEGVLRQGTEYAVVGNELIIYKGTFDTLNLENIKELPFTVTFDVVNGSNLTDGFKLIAQ